MPTDKLKSTGFNAEIYPDEELLNKFFASIDQNSTTPYSLETIPGLSATLTQGHIANAFNRIKTHLDFRNAISNMMRGSLIVFKRDKTSNDSRTIRVLRGYSDEYCALMELGRKTATGAYRNIDFGPGSKYTWFAGGECKIKYCVRIDTPEPELWVKKVPLTKGKDPGYSVEEALKVEKVLKIFSGVKGFLPAVMRIDDSIVYERYMPANLMEFLQGQWWPAELPEPTPEQRKAVIGDIINQIIDIVSFMHSKGIEHKDLKLQNFMIDYNSKKGAFEVAITDYGTYQEFGKREKAIGTRAYMPPWIFMESAFLDGTPEPEVLAGLIDSRYIGARMLSNPYISSKVIEESKVPHKSDGSQDVFAVGEIVYNLLTGDINPKWSEALQSKEPEASFLHEVCKGVRSEMQPISAVKEMFSQSEFNPRHNKALGDALHVLTDPANATTAEQRAERTTAAINEENEKLIQSLDAVKSFLSDEPSATDQSVFMEHLLKICPTESNPMFFFNPHNTTEYKIYDAVNKIRAQLQGILAERSPKELQKKLEMLKDLDKQIEVFFRGRTKRKPQENSVVMRLNPEDMNNYARYKLFVGIALEKVYQKIAEPPEIQKSRFFLGFVRSPSAAQKGNWAAAVKERDAMHQQNNERLNILLSELAHPFERRLKPQES